MVRFLSGFFGLPILVACAVAPGASTSAAQPSSEPAAASTPCPWKGRNEQETQKLCADAAQWAATHPQAQPTPCPYHGTDRLLQMKYCEHQTNLDPQVIDDAYRAASKSAQGGRVTSTTHWTMPDGTIVGSDGSVIVPQN